MLRFSHSKNKLNQNVIYPLNTFPTKNKYRQINLINYSTLYLQVCSNPTPQEFRCGFGDAEMLEGDH